METESGEVLAVLQEIREHYGTSRPAHALVGTRSARALHPEPAGGG